MSFYPRAAILFFLAAAVTPYAVAQSPNFSRTPPNYYEFNNSIPEGQLEVKLLVTKFQMALVASQWEEALAYCSDRVTEAAKTWPSPEEFIKGTVPYDALTTNHIGNGWSDSYFLEHNEKPPCAGGFTFPISISPWAKIGAPPWHFYACRTDSGWRIDWEPTRLVLEDYYKVAREKQEAYRAARKKEEQARLDILAPKLPYINTHILPLRETFVVDEPMPFRIEVRNFGDESVYHQGGPPSLKLFNARNVEIPRRIKGPMQTVTGGVEELPANSTVVLSEEIDLLNDFDIPRPGTYYVQFDGMSLQIGERYLATLSVYDLPFVEDNTLGKLPMLTATSQRFPSNIVQIEVVANPMKNSDTAGN